MRKIKCFGSIILNGKNDLNCSPNTPEIQVIHRAIDILEFVAEHSKEPVQLIKIAEKLNLSQPTTANIIKTLADRNYLENVSRKSGYRLGAGAYQLTGNLSYNQNLVYAAKPVMEALTGELNETSLLGVLLNNKRVILHTVQSDQDLQVRAKTEADVFSTASGRLLLAFLGEKELNTLIQAFGYPAKDVWPGVQNQEDLRNTLAKIRKDQMAQTLSSKHIVGFAVPIYRNKLVIASLSIFLPESRLTPTHKNKITTAIKRAAKKIEERIEKEFEQ